MFATELTAEEKTCSISQANQTFIGVDADQQGRSVRHVVNGVGHCDLHREAQLDRSDIGDDQ